MPCRPPPRNSRSPMPLPLRHQSHPPSSKSDKIRPNLSENGDGTTTDLNHVFRLHSHSHPQNRTETGQKCLKTGRNGNRFPSAPSPSPKSDGISPIPSENEAKLPRIRKTKYHSFALFRLSSHPGFTRPPLLGLRMADSGSCEMLGGLYMAAKSRYREYGARNRNARTRDIRVSVPYISHLAKHGPPNLPYISEIAPNNAPFTPGTAPTTAP